jgi:hypothetical protein
MSQKTKNSHHKALDRRFADGNMVNHYMVVRLSEVGRRAREASSLFRPRRFASSGRRGFSCAPRAASLLEFDRHDRGIPLPFRADPRPRAPKSPRADRGPLQPVQASSGQRGTGAGHTSRLSAY